MTDINSLDPKLNKVYSNPGDKRQLFDDWAKTYDKDLTEDFGYVAHTIASQKLIELVPDKEARILDVGCGTGLVGRHLHVEGYIHIDGNDYSPEMLEKARESSVYCSLEEHDITQPVIVDQLYDASIAVGVFAFSVPNAENMVNVVNCNKVGSPSIITVNGKAWLEKDWPTQLEIFSKNHPDIVIDSIEPIDYLTAQGIDGRLMVLRRKG